MKTPLIYDKALWITSGHWEKFRENMFLIPGDTDEQTYGMKPMNCPGHMLLYGESFAKLPRAADPLRGGGSVASRTSSQERCTG